MSNKVELKLCSSVSEYDFFWGEDYIGTIFVNNKEAAQFRGELAEHLSKPEILRALADTLESLNKKV